MNLVAYWNKNVVPYLRAVFGRSERGAALVEYALLVALIAVVCIAAIQLLGDSAKDKFNEVGSEISSAGS
ncbi:MAG: Flp family type IVb pilin [Acidimicrobiales bacterium]|nr:Flp family type IVb pilin [Actinomycetota bacterium]